MSLVRQIRSMFFTFDLFGSPVALLVKKEGQYKTTVGTVFSVCILAFILYYFFNSINDMISLKNPNIIQSINFSQDPEQFFVTPENFRVSLEMRDMDNRPVQNNDEERFFTFQLSVCQNTLVDEEKRKRLVTYCQDSPLIQCLSNPFNELYSKLGIDPRTERGIYCLNQKEWQKNPIKLQGTVSNEIFNYFSIKAIKCDPRSNPNCASDDEINQFMSSGNLAFRYVDNLLNQQRYQSPYQPINRLQTFSYSATQSKLTAFVYLKHSKIQTTNQPFLFFGSQTLDHVLQVDHLEQNSGSAIAEDVFIQINFMLHQDSSTYIRTYPTIFDILGNTQGLYGFLTLVIGLFVIPLSENMMNKTILESIYQFQQEEEKQVAKIRSNHMGIIGFPIEKSEKQMNFSQLSFGQHQNNISPDRINKFKQPTSNGKPLVRSSTLLQLSGKNNQRELKTLFKQKTKKLNISGCEYLSTLFCGKKAELMKKGLDKVSKQMDIIFLINKLNELDKLKVLLLSQNQQKLFEFIPKPIVGPQVTQSQIKPFDDVEFVEPSLFQEEKPFQLRIEDGVQAYKLLQAENASEIDKKLLRLIDIDIKKMFDYIAANDENENNKLEASDKNDLSIENLVDNALGSEK